MSESLTLVVVDLLVEVLDSYLTLLGVLGDHHCCHLKQSLQVKQFNLIL
jgi:hypothetical protein